MDWFSVQHEGQRLGHLGIGMRGDGDLELQCRRRGDLDFEVCAHISLHSADDRWVQWPRRVGVCGKPSAPPDADSPSRSAAPPSESHVDWAAAVSLRLALGPTPALSISVTVNEARGAAGADPPISAWLPIARDSVMCVMTVSLSICPPAEAGCWWLSTLRVR